MARLDVLFAFEEDGLALGMETIRPVEDALDRWCKAYPPTFAGLGQLIVILYQLRDGRFVQVKAGGCHRRLERRNWRKKEIWYSSHAPESHVVSAENAADFLLRCRMQIPPELEQAAQLLLNPPPPAVRDLSHWAGQGLMIQDHPRPAHEIDVLQLAESLIARGIRFIQELGAWSEPQSRRKNHEIFRFGVELFARYPVVSQHWWKAIPPIPPRAVGVTDLPWPSELSAARASLAELQVLLDAPLTAFRLRHGNDPSGPTDQELVAVEAALIAAIPAVEASIVNLQQGTAKIRAANEAKTAEPAQPDPGPEPSKDDFTIYRIWKLTGDKQQRVAELFTEQTGKPMTQGQVSRSKGRVLAWLDAGNMLPPIDQSERPTELVIDPAVLDLGPRVDGRTIHQREQPSHDA